MTQLSSLAASLAVVLGLAGCDATRGWVLLRADDLDAHVQERADASSTATDGGAVTSADPDLFAGACSPRVSYRNDDAAGSGQLFDAEIADPAAKVVEVARRVCSLLYRTPSEVPVAGDVALIVESFDGVADASNDRLRISSSYLQEVADRGDDLHAEILGILHFLLTNVYQLSDEDDAAPAWVVTGIADCVRYQAGYTPLARRAAGGQYSDGFQTAGFFFAWLDSEQPGFVYQLNASLSPDDGSAWTAQAFVELTGESVDALWTRYQAAL